MIKLFLIILIIFTGCSIEKKKNIFNKKKDIAKEKVVLNEENQNNKILKKNFNTNLEINLTEQLEEKLSKELKNNYGRNEYKSISYNSSKYKLKKIKNFSNFEPKIVFDKEGIIFFEKQGTLIKYDYLSKVIWKKNHYSKQEKKSNPLIYFGNDKNTLIATDSLAKYYRIDLASGKLLWSKIHSSPFNSQIKIFKDKFYAIDFENAIHCFSLKNGEKIWSYQTENFFIKSKKKLSIIIDNQKVIFNNSIGDITAVDAKDGMLIWQTPTQNNQIYAKTISLRTSDLVSENESIFFSNNRNEFYSLNKNDGFLNWKQTINSDIRPIITNKTIFTVSNEGFLFLIDSRNGNILKTQDLFDNFNDRTRKLLKPIGMILGVDKIYITLNNGRMIIAELKDGKFFKIIKIDSNSISVPTIFNKKLYIVKDNSIVEFD